MEFWTIVLIPQQTNLKKIAPITGEYGTWEQSNLTGFKGSISRYSRDVNAYVRYTAKVSEARYCLRVFRVTHPNSVNQAEILIKNGNETIDRKFVDYSLAKQIKAGFPWETTILIPIELFQWKSSVPAELPVSYVRTPSAFQKACP